ncbi:zinc finger BED domain-containing protein RICESLEEPER 1-like isoform X2 [Malania oleifera]|uniref:zinc finger BED domain-containing protein RICESLEEPER 1-like isoform X2 n=2 Tax=Malania oleifera TaxID=397392 RepID=UPI0025ADBA8B|nr:zinc finger BED domain-containing protein RICESLEEPER 1-like isoform X2 [Malania oleifera]
METLNESVIVKSSRLKSVVWNDFDRVKSGDTCVAVCRHCKKKLSGSSTSGTSHLRNHLFRCRRRSNHDIAQMVAAREKKKEGTVTLPTYNFASEQKKDEMLQLVNVKFEQEQMQDSPIDHGNVNFDQNQSHVDLARMIILHAYPLAMVEHDGFRIFVKNLQPLFEHVSLSRIEIYCKEIYEKEKQKVYEVFDKLPGKISLGFDTWAAPEDAVYLCLTAHYIDEAWQLNKKILNFMMITCYAEDSLSEVIMTCLMDWDIDRKLFSITFDCCPTNDNVVFRVKDRLSQNKFLLCNGKLFDVRCAANVLKLIVLDALEGSCEVIHKIRDSILYIRSSQTVQQKFNEMAQQVGIDCRKCLRLDNRLQWNSTYVMLEAALEYRNAFVLLREHDPVHTICPSDIEWDRVTIIVSYLKLFFEVTSAFTRCKSPTANLYFPEICDIHLQLIEWCKNSDDYISFLTLKMKSRFDEFWSKCSLALAVAAIFDPRFKMKLIEYYYPQIYGGDAQVHIDYVSDTIKELFNEHAICSPLASLDQGLSWQVSSSVGPNSGYTPSAVNDSRDRLTGFDMFLHETSQSESIQSELDKYLEEPLFPRNVDFSVLDWWKIQTPRYPILSMMARNILGIPVSKVSLQSAFNTGGKVLDHIQSSLSPDTMQALMCARDWMQNVQDGT